MQGTGIGQVNSNIQLQAYPNPTSSAITVKASKGELIESIEVFDVTGRMVLATKANASNISINLAELTNGIYNVRAHTNKGTGSVRLVKN